MKSLPTSTATFSDIIEGNFLYVDKTEYIYQLVKPAKGMYFLSRPRRFGKSLLISTLDELFQGNRTLFKGLWIDESDYEWNSYPIMRFDMSRHGIRNVIEWEESIHAHLRRIARDYGITLENQSLNIMFEELIFALAEQSQSQKVVILIDEYDKPIIDLLEDVAEAKLMRNALRRFYTVIKSMESHIRFVMITGISKFTKVSIFSELNNLTDLTMHPSFTTALGLTTSEIQHYFGDRFQPFAQQEELSVEDFLEKVQVWYDGFRFSDTNEGVYNPYSTMQLFDAQRFANYWFESGTPTFLIKLLRQKNYDIQQLENLQVGELAFSTYDVEKLDIIPLLFQTGYLTIKDYDRESQRYTLYYPNYEVERAFLIYLLDAFSDQATAMSESHLWQLIDALQANDLDDFFTVLKVFFANVNHDLYIKNEKYYQTIFYLIFKLMGLPIEAEVKTNDGRIDAVAELADHIYIFEFKLDESADKALTQIEDKEYTLKYALHGKPITKVGVNFDSQKRQIGKWKIAEE